MKGHDRTHVLLKFLIDLFLNPQNQSSVCVAFKATEENAVKYSSTASQRGQWADKTLHIWTPVSMRLCD